MSNEWQDLPNMAAVCTAQADDWEIEEFYMGDWVRWMQQDWTIGTRYRGRPKQPETKKVYGVYEFERQHERDVATLESWNAALTELQKEVALLRSTLLTCRSMVGHPDNIAIIDCVYAKTGILR